MAKTLARVLSVPFSMSDCTPFTQAGYIGEDAEVCVQRLLAASNYDVEAAERGIIVLDEVDKIATSKVSHGKDVSGEGVQQALLKIIEGTTVQLQAKSERNAPRAGGAPNAYPTSSPLSGGTPGGGQPQKGETYNVRTDNILFIFTGAFTGLQKIILDRISKGSIGFGQPVRATSSSSFSSTSTEHSSVPVRIGSEEEALYKKHIPFFTSSSIPDDGSEPSDIYHYYNPLDLLTPPDLQKYGLIPELIGRIPVSAALSALSVSALVRVLTEPRNNLVAQYQTLFSLSGIELRLTSPALHEVAKAALEMGTGARGLRTEMERLLADAMFEVPGSSVKFVLVTGQAARKEKPVVYLSRGQGAKFHDLIAREEEAWEEEERQKRGGDEAAKAASFEEWRGKAAHGASAGS